MYASQVPDAVVEVNPPAEYLYYAGSVCLLAALFFNLIAIIIIRHILDSVTKSPALVIFTVLGLVSLAILTTIVEVYILSFALKPSFNVTDTATTAV